MPSSSAGQREESELEAVHGGADLVFGQWRRLIGKDQSRVLISDDPQEVKRDTGVILYFTQYIFLLPLTLPELARFYQCVFDLQPLAQTRLYSKA